MKLKAQRCGTLLVTAILMACLAGGAQAQESLDRGKNPAQLFASDCSVCHKSPQGLAKSGGLLGIDSFLREHYTTSRESAAALGSYLRSMDSGPGPARAAKRTTKGDEKAKPDEKKKPGSKPGEVKGIDKKPDAAAGEPKSTDSKPSDSRPADIMAPERKSAEPKPSAPAAGEAKPAEGAKPEKLD
jgi:hypothetical protein